MAPRALGAVVIALACAACGGAPAKRAPQAAPKPAQSGDPRERAADAAALKPVHVSALEGRYETSVLAAGTAKVETQAAEDLTIAALEIPIGAAEPVRCSVSPGRADASRFLAHFLGLVKTERPKMTVVAHKSGPVLFATASYRAAGGKGRGTVKLAVAPRAIGSLSCVHDDVGYAKTFERVFLSAIEGRTSPSEATPDSWVEITRVSEGGATVGFAETRTRPADGGRESTESFVAMVAKEREVVFLEGMTVTRVDKRGDLAELRYVHLANGALLEVVRVERRGMDYAYKGEREGKPVAGTIPTVVGRPPLTTWLGQLAGLRAVAKGEKNELRYWVIDDADVPAASEVVVRREGNRVVKEEGANKSEITLADDGTVTRARRGDLELARLFARGTP
jgi:hypothetical protein